MSYKLDALRKTIFSQVPSTITNTFSLFDWTHDEETGIVSANAISSWALGNEGYCTMRIVFAMASNTLQSIIVECTPFERPMEVYVVLDVGNQEEALARWAEFLANYKALRESWLDSAGSIGDVK
jgi:hypothetical protein